MLGANLGLLLYGEVSVMIRFHTSMYLTGLLLKPDHWNLVQHYVFRRCRYIPQAGLV